MDDEPRKYTKKELKHLPVGTVLAEGWRAFYFKTQSGWVSSGGSIWTATEVSDVCGPFSTAFTPASD